jgi:CubicO group peptidase (beta-lactamase class C family)
VTLIVHKGKIVFHEAFGKNGDGILITRATPLWMASITKMLTGMLFMQFVDQGLVDLDAPVERYLPELASNELKKITVRHLFTHTTGLSWVGEWGSDWEPSLENRIANAIPYAHIGERFEYNRIGYALAGKIMEHITGRAVPYLFREYIFDPLHIQNAYADNTYGGLYCSAEELAVIAQTLLQQGSYGSTQLFSTETFKKMLPIDLSIINPNIKRKWGVGTALLGGNGLSETTFGHEAASGAIVRIDPKNELVIVSARNSIGDNYGEYERFVRELIEQTTKPLRSAK